MKRKTYIVFAILLLLAISSIVNLGNTTKTVSGDNSKIAWGIGKEKDSNGQPVDCVKANQTYLQYNTYFVGANTPTIYLTFDNGYENGNTVKILDILNANNVHATFFITGVYAREQFDLIKRMISEGHIIGNHSFGHKEYALLSSEERIKDLGKLHHLMEERYGYTMQQFRFPKGEFSVSALKDVEEYGYKTLFWSFAYYDYNIKDQPSNDKALAKLIGGLHPGAIYLLHSVSDANVNVLDEFIKEAKKQGYSFAILP